MANGDTEVCNFRNQFKAEKKPILVFAGKLRPFAKPFPKANENIEFSNFNF